MAMLPSSFLFGTIMFLPPTYGSYPSSQLPVPIPYSPFPLLAMERNQSQLPQQFHPPPFFYQKRSHSFPPHGKLLAFPSNSLCSTAVLPPPFFACRSRIFRHRLLIVYLIYSSMNANYPAHLPPGISSSPFSYLQNSPSPLVLSVVRLGFARTY